MLLSLHIQQKKSLKLKSHCTISDKNNNEGCRSEGASTPFELEALCVDNWVTVLEAQETFCEAQSTGSRSVESEIRKKLQYVDSVTASRGEQDVDSMMMRVRGKQAAKQNGDALNILNQVI